MSYPTPPAAPPVAPPAAIPPVPPPPASDLRPKTLAVVALCLAVAGALLALIPFVTWFSGIVLLAAFVISLVALIGKKHGGKAMGISALVISVVGWIVSIVMAIASFGILGQAALDETVREDTASASDSSSESTSDAGSAQDDDSAEAAEVEPEAPEMTTAQESAVRSAKSYISLMGFSRAGLLQQLTSEYGEGFELADAEFAVAHIEAEGGVDWNAEAVESAESYLDVMGFSRQGLFEQLTSTHGEQFTEAQANHALDAVGL